MSDLLNKASLVMIPSGYKEDVVYSAVPTDGSGDLSFTRASNGTRVNSAGLVEVCPWNLLSNSEEFSSANGWSASTVGGSTASQTSNYGVAPNGTTTADRIQLALNGQSYADWLIAPTLPIVVGQTYTYSIYLKSLSGTPTIYFFNDGTGNFAKTLTSEWVRYDYTWTATSTSIYPRFLLQSGSSTSADLLAWGYQLNIGSTAKPYFPTTDRLNVPRLTYQNGGGGCPSLLLEKQSTNLLTYSEDFTNAVWNTVGGNVSAPVITANQTISPDGTQNADKIVLPSVSNSGDFSVVYRAPDNLSGKHTTSIYLKGENGGEQVYLYYYISGYNNKLCTLTTDWQRFDLTFTGGSSSYWHIGVDLRSGSGQSAKPSQTIYAWGAQLEASSYPTSYIPTTSSSATRVADACYKTGISSLIGQTEGTIFADINPEEFQTGSYLGITDGTITNRIIFGFESGSVNSGTLLVFGLSGLSSGGTYTRGQRIKVALAYKSGDSVLYVNGSQVQTATTTFSGSFSQFRFDSFAGTQNFIGKVNESLL